MLLSSVIIILREVLEAALLFSILIALTKQSGLKLHWVGWSSVIGVIGAVAYAMNIGLVSEWFDGVGQEVVNAFIQLGTYCMLVLYMIMQILFKHQKTTIFPDPLKQNTDFILMLPMIIITSLAIMREGSEILLYFFSAIHSENHYIAVIIGMTIGASIGISIGFLFYYFLINLTYKWTINVGLILLILVSAGMLSQAILLLIQADWLPAQLPIWDTSDWLSEKSVMGQLLYALIGYEATPTAIQVTLYSGSLFLPVLIISAMKIILNKSTELSVNMQDQ